MSCPLVQAQSAAQVELFSPEGTVKDVRQVAARFSAPMTALGDPRLTDPFDIDCPAAGEGRWVDTRHWVYDFEGELPAGVVCRFSLKERLTTYDGAPLEGPRVFRFDTGGPAVRASLPRAGSQSVDENQTFILATDAPTATASVHDNAYCAVTGLAERIPVRVLEGDERESVLAQRRELGYAYYSILWKDSARTVQRVRDGTILEAERSLTVLTCARPLPPATIVRLVWGAGIAASSGRATTDDQVLAFRTRPAFTARLACQRASTRAACMPIKPLRAVFSAPVPRETALQARIRGPNGQETSPVPDDSTASPMVESVSFPPSYVERGTFELHLPADLRDDAGRPLENAASFPLEFTTDDFPPLARFAGDFGILEAEQGGVLPVTLRNLDARDTPDAVRGRKLRVVDDAAEIARWLRRRDGLGTDASIFSDDDTAETFEVPVADGGPEAEVVGIPLERPGFYVVELASPKLGAVLNDEPSVYHVRTAALVTHLAVHFKWGRERSLIWVTRLENGAPVAGAEVMLTDMCTGTELWRGRSGADGTARIEGAVLGEPRGYGSCRYSPPVYMASARLADDTSFVLSVWNEGLEPHAFGLRTGSAYNAEVVHTVFDRPLFRAGETVSMKHFFRHRSMAGIGLGTQARTLPVEIRHMGSGQSYDVEVPVGPEGIGEQSWKIPPEARLGDYAVNFRFDNDTWRESGRFKVQEFRVPTMRAVVQGPAGPQARPEDVTIDLHLRYLAGGSAAGAAVKLRTASSPLALRFAGYEDYQFGGEPVTEGRQVRSGTYDFDAETTEAAAVRSEVMPLALDQDGAARVVLPVAGLDRAERITTELEYADPNGEILTSAGHVDLWPAAFALGIRREGWVASEDEVRFRVLAVDLAGKPVSRQKVVARLYVSNTYSYRKRLIGGFYAYESVTETEPLDRVCRGRTNDQGLLFCNLAPGVSGQVLVRAETSDSAGNSAGATTSIWVVGEDDWWFGSAAADRMDVLAEDKDYEAGEVARFQVRMPFRAATALVTVEREGVLDQFVTGLSGREPVVEVPIKPNYAPNVFVSVLAVRGRVGGFRSWFADRARQLDLGQWMSRDGGRPTALVDLSKPAYRLGNAEIRVGWAPYRLDVTVDPEQRVYRVRDEAKVRIRAVRADGMPAPAGAEVAVAVVDEGLLELAPNGSWALLDAMMGRRGIEVWTATAQMQVIGKRHYGRKAVPHGGGGGRERARELFDTLVAWHGRVSLDDNGEAELTVPLNDSLTSFRVVAVAHAGAQLFGTGGTTIATTQDLMVLSGLPPLVRERDSFAATFTVRNASSRDIDAEITATASVPGARLEAQRVALKAGEARDIVWQVEAPVDQSTIQWEVAAAELGGDAGDRIKVSQDLVSAYPVRVHQATISQLDGPVQLPLERPEGALPGRGGVAVALRSRLGDGLDGVRRYMQSYRYTCLEQTLSRAVALREPAMWERWMERLPAYLDDDGLLKYFPVDGLQGEDILTSYVLAIAHEAGWAIPHAARTRLIAGLSGFTEGRIVRRSALPTADLAVRKVAAIEALSRYDAARPAMLSSIVIEPNLWPTSAVIDWMNVLTRVEEIPDRTQRLAEAEQIIRSRVNFQGTTMGFSTEQADALWWLMVSGDANAVRALATLVDRPGWRSDVPRLVRGALGRQLQGHWDTTVANAWGVLAMEKFSAIFENEPVTGTTALAYADARNSAEWTAQGVEETVEFPWHDEPAELAIDHRGGGKPWVMAQTLAALPLERPLFSGYRIERTISPVEQQTPGRWTRGDLMRVRLDLEAQSDMTWVVVDDPVPAGATILGSGLGGQSRLATGGERREGWVWPAFEERRFDAFRAYYRRVPKGKWAVEYTVRLNNPGVFQLPATRVEAMYAPEMFGERPNPPLTVESLR